MTVPVPGSLAYSYDEDGVTTVFPYPVRFLEPQELVVIREAAGVQARLVYNVDYTVSGAGHPSGGSITRTAVTSGGKIIIERDTAWKQIVDLDDKARNPADAVELQLDRLTMAGQDVRAAVEKFSDGFADLSNAVGRAEFAQAAAEGSADLAEDAQLAAETAQGLAELAQGLAEGAKIASEQSAIDALAAKTQAELAAISAGAPLYPSVEDGEAGTSDGDIFLVSIEAGVQVFQNDTGTGNMLGWLGKASFKTVAGLLAFAGPLGPVGTHVEAGGFPYEVVSSDEHVENANGVKLKALPNARNEITTEQLGVVGDGIADDTLALGRAIGFSDRDGFILDWMDRTYKLTDTISKTLTRGLAWRANDAKVDFDPGADKTYGIDITLPAGVYSVLGGGGIDLNGNGYAHWGWRFYQPEADGVGTIRLSRIAARNTEMQAAVGFSSGGMRIMGGFGLVELIEPRAENIMMRAGAGVPGSRSINGISVINTGAAAYPLRTRIVRPRVHKVWSADPAYDFDMDGIGVFANPAGVNNAFGKSTLEIIEPDISSCWGRDIKMQVFRATVIDPKSLADEGPSTGIKDPAIDSQTGSLTLTRGHFVQDGIGRRGLVAASNTGAGGAPLNSVWDGGVVDIRNGATLVTLVASTSGFDGPANTSVRRLTVYGEVETLGSLRVNNSGKQRMAFEDVIVDSIRDYGVRVWAGPGGAAPYAGIVSLKGVRNLGTPVDAAEYRTTGNVATAYAYTDNCEGIIQNPSMSLTAFNVRGGGMSESHHLTPEIDKEAPPLTLGADRNYTFSLGQGAVKDIPVASVRSTLVFITMGLHRLAYAIISADSNGSPQIIAEGTSAKVGGSSDPGSGDLRVWQVSGAIRIKNGTATNRDFTVKLFG